MVYLCIIYWFIYVQLVAWGVVLQDMTPLGFFKKYGPQVHVFLHFGYCFAKHLLKFITTSL